jgi:hypothetical protein
MKRLLESLTPARVALGAMVCVAALGGAAYAALSSSGSSEASRSAVSGMRSGGAATPVAVEQHRKTSRHAARPKVEQARAKVRRYVKVRKVVEKKPSRRHPVAARDSSTLSKARVAKPSVSTPLPRVRKARRTDRSHVTAKQCRRAAPLPKRSDQPAPVRTCKPRSNQPTPPTPPPPAPPTPQPGDDR